MTNDLPVGAISPGSAEDWRLADIEAARCGHVFVRCPLTGRPLRVVQPPQKVSNG